MFHDRRFFFINPMPEILFFLLKIHIHAEKYLTEPSVH
tara:strand:- start:8 stop:121 length:114 start_codon:yes stop_codon:yes gene_type:complete